MQEGHSVYGVGQSEAEAIKSASRLGPPNKIAAALVDRSTAYHGDIVLCECTEELFDQVRMYGVEQDFEYTEGGLLDVECHAPNWATETELYAS
jgi:hypothetical protein